MKLEGTLNGIPIYSSPDVPKDMVYFINDNNIGINYPRRKDGKPDMRFSINRLMKSIVDNS